MRLSLKKILTVTVALSLALCIAACGKKTEDDMTGSETAITENTETTQPDPAPEPAKETEAPEEQEPEEEPPVQQDPPRPLNTMPRPEGEAIEFLMNMKIGWSLGNTFDAYDCTWLSNELDYESGWNGVKTTKELITAVKEAGFNTLRVPVSWHNHVSDGKDYTISPQWLDRVNEVVDYGIDQGMYVIINIHHDNNEKFLYPSKKYEEQSVAYVTAIWKQLSERFKDYDEHLLFAGMNEPRLVGHTNEWWIDNSSQDCKDAIEIINRLNQTFVDTVRASGGNNATRYLICPGYCASPDGIMNMGFVIPTDPVDNDHHIILSAHAYTPYDFALENPGTSEWSSKNDTDVSNMVGFMQKLYETYVKKGIPVIIDEFGAMNKKGNTAARADFATYYVRAARARWMPCIWWDNGAFEGDGELFGIIDRTTCKWKYPEIMQGMMDVLNRFE